MKTHRRFQEIVRTLHIYRGFEVKLSECDEMTDLMEKHGWQLIDYCTVKHWLFRWKTTVYLVFMIDKEKVKTGDI